MCLPFRAWPFQKDIPIIIHACLCAKGWKGCDQRKSQINVSRLIRLPCIIELQRIDFGLFIFFLNCARTRKHFPNLFVDSVGSCRLSCEQRPKKKNTRTVFLCLSFTEKPEQSYLNNFNILGFLCSAKGERQTSRLLEASLLVLGRETFPNYVCAFLRNRLRFVDGSLLLVNKHL